MKNEICYMSSTQTLKTLVLILYQSQSACPYLSAFLQMCVSGPDVWSFAKCWCCNLFRNMLLFSSVLEYIWKTVILLLIQTALIKNGHCNKAEILDEKLKL